MLEEKFPERSIAMSAFNKHIAEELQRKLPHINAFTMNSFGFRACIKHFKSKLNQYKLDDILEVFIPQNSSLKYSSNEIKKLVNLCKYNLYDGKNLSELQSLTDKHELDFKENEDIVFNLIPKILSKCAQNIKEVDFTDQLWFVYAHNLPVPNFDYFFGDEVQDWNPLQRFTVLKAIKDGGRLILVGDRFQSIYAFCGADSDSIPNLIEECEKTKLGVKTLPLYTTFRCPVKHIQLANQIVPDLRARLNAPQGVIEKIGAEKASELILDNDLMICFRNAPLITFAYRLIRAGKTCVVKGRDIGTGLKALIKKLKATSIPQLIEKAENFRLKETIRFKQKGERRAESQILALNDKIDTLLALCEGVRGPQELEQRINTLFSDEKIENAITLSSVHKAKGMEAKNVFIIETPVFPARQEWMRQSMRNLTYVSHTRSLDKMYFVG